MSRPLGLETDAIVDASVQAHAQSVVERRFTASQLPRLTEAGIGDPADITVSIRFSNYENRVALDGQLTGQVTMTCQRCMKPVAVDVTDEFRLLVVEDEADPVAESGGFEPLIADPARLDLRWLAEEQTLLGAPLVPKHDDERCASEVIVQDEEAEEVGQRPFANLRNLLREQ